VTAPDTERTGQRTAAPNGGVDRAAAVLFDMDGLLIDSEPLWTVAEQELAASLGGQWSQQIKAVVVGTRLEYAVPAILDWYGVANGPAEVAAATTFLLDRMVELFDEALPLSDGAVELVEALRERGVKLGLVSSSYRVLVDAALRDMGDVRFDVTLAGDEVRHGKPDPEPYLTTCLTLGVDPAATVVLEDAPSGVTSGEAAGCVVVAVPSVADIAATPTRPVVTRLADIDPDWLIGLPGLVRSRHG
jgi:HAD superfamily hydrolase (TIGR01509 family)